MYTQHTATQQLDEEAMWHFFAVMDAEGNLAEVLSKVSSWLRQTPAHRKAWQRARRTSRLMVAYLKATEAGASRQEIHAFFAVVAEERRRAPEEFADA